MGVKRWKLITSAIISLGIIVLAVLNRHWIVEAFGLLNDAKPGWLLAALTLIALSYLMSAQVFNVVLHSLGYRISLLRLWATALTAIIISQSVPAGGVGSYAFLMSNFNRRGIRTGESALLASLETLSYVVAMLLVFSFSLAYFAWHGLRAAGASYIAGLVGLSVIGIAIYVLTRSEATLRHWLSSIHYALNRLLRRRWSDAWVDRIATDIARGRSLLIHRRRDVILLVLIQLTALSGHSLAMLLVLRALGTEVSFAIVLAAFGVALVTSTFNVLPGGGGTVEAALVAVFSQMGVGPAAVPAAIIFRLFNYWLAAPIAAICYHWLMHEHVTPLINTKRRTMPLEAPSHD
ncbi:lysylphosphatidylglycerol synthase transmembrane domain-containing protein [uncultured Chloroflexus sp.]|uniref:lysylphosphatidylglycerol synthase transmembrane domain-containing protein n=1 Tax=uncultured Chloroflexus sp. TaxID=214040 RepID=UPI002611A516|nr:lysylphosphatidylglycerol synthase transmembrane domain-containing protein [uncultured Chloroflexus sp.]